MKFLTKKHLIMAGVCAGILAVLVTVLLLFSCGAENEAQSASGIESGAESRPLTRAEQLYPAVEVVTNNGESAFASHRPDGYPAKVRDVLAMMMSLHKQDTSYLYHVAFRDGEAGDACTKDTIVKRLADAGTLYAEEWAEISAYDPQAKGWFYFLFTADEIRTLAAAGIECRFVGSGEVPDDGGKFDLDQAKEQACQISGDSFRAKTGE